jgi:hypothetical protein
VDLVVWFGERVGGFASHTSSGTLGRNLDDIDKFDSRFKRR